MCESIGESIGTSVSTGTATGASAGGVTYGDKSFITESVVQKDVLHLIK